MSGPVLLALRILMALGLYAFLAWGLLAMWKEIRQQGALLAGRKAPPISLTIWSGDRPPQTRHFARSDLTIGRDPACDLVLDDEAVSGQHLRLSYHHGQWWAEDMHSTNGTLLNGCRLSIPTVVVAEDELVCGQTRLAIGLTENAPKAPASSLHEPLGEE